MKRFLLLASLFVVLIFGIYIAFFKPSSGEISSGFRVEKVKRGTIVQTVSASGTVNPVAMVSVGTQVSGTIKYIYVDFNDNVKKGQVIALIDPALFEAQVEQAKANLLLAKANLRKAEATLKDALRTYERNKILLTKDLIARSEVDAAETNYNTAVAQVNAAKAQVLQAEASLKSAETNLRYTKIISPVDGVVISRNVDVGQTVAASFQTPTLFAIAQDLSKMQINTNVAEADIGKIRIDQPVEFTVDAYPEVIFNGKVFQVRLAPINVQNVVTYDVVIVVENEELKLKPGMTANVSIITDRKEDVLRVPNSAFRVKIPGLGSSEGKEGKGVWTLENGKPRFIGVEPGITDGTYTEIRSGLKEGQEVIVESGVKPGETKKNNKLPGLFKYGSH